MNKASWRNSPFSNKEKIQTEIYESSLEASKSVAHEIALTIKQRASENKKCVLGLATGSTPKTLYAELIRLHKEDGLSFANVVTFNLDEYYPMIPTDIQSYHLFMHEHLFDHLDIPKEQIHIPRGDLAREEVVTHCEEYERMIDQQGGIDIQILGIGRTGHIGFNEPGSSKESGTRMISLDHITRVDAASDFFGEENVPKQAVTMGIGSIMKAKKVFIMAWGEGKSAIVKDAIEGEVDERIPATYLQHHSDAIFILDEAAGAMLTRQCSPWVLGEIQWSDELAKKAVMWLCLRLGKPILKLTNRDYTDNGMGDLLLEKGSAYDLNIDIFNKMQRTITGWPGGKPNADDSHRPERKDPARKRVIIFSPHPDDDVISMGGTFIRLVQQGHEVHVAYQTSGNIAVFNEDVIQYADFVDLLSVSGLMQQKTSLHEQVQKDIRNKKVSEEDSPAVRQVKGLIRKAEARAASHYVGLPDDQIHFLDLPFYETGQIKKNPIGQEDIDITKALIDKIAPHQIFVAGDLSDPHGTHRVCLDSVFQALDQLRGKDYLKDCWIWMYRGAWQEWPIDEIEMAVPLSPDELMKKRRAIFKHQSQKDSALFPGHDPREFWQRAEDRNRETARQYDLLGLAEYEAMEAFKRYQLF
jgi:glucosamine-6-phosphate deaminase